MLNKQKIWTCPVCDENICHRQRIGYVHTEPTILSHLYLHGWTLRQIGAYFERDHTQILRQFKIHGLATRSSSPAEAVDFITEFSQFGVAEGGR